MMRKNKRLLLFLSISIFCVGILIFVFFVRSQFCLLARDGEICYQSKVFQSSFYGAHIFNDFYEFVQTGRDKDLVYLSDEIKKHYGARAVSELRETFQWVKEDSLVTVVLIGNTGAMVLEDGGERGVVYFDAQHGQVIVDFDTDLPFLPVDVGWVNSGYGGGYSLGYSFSLGGGGACVYRKRGVILRSKNYESLDGGGVLCKFDRYQVIDRGGEVKILPAGADWKVGYAGILDSTMRFLRYVTN